MAMLNYFLPSLKNWRTNPDNDKEDEVVDRAREMEEVVVKATEMEETDNKANELEEDADSLTEWEDAKSEWNQVEDEATELEEVEDVSTKCEEVKNAATEGEKSGGSATKSKDILDEITVREKVAEENEESMAMDPVHKVGHLICKIDMDENGNKTRKGKRAWKPFNAVLQGMVLYLQKDKSNWCKTDNAIRLNHALAYTVDYKKRPHVLCLRTADLRHFYFQAESEVEQASWVVTINCIAACYSAPPLTPVSHDKKARCPQFLPSFPTRLSLDQQLECYMNQFLKASTHLCYYNSLPIRDGSLSLDYMVQEVTRYKTYVRVLQRLVAAKDAGGGFSESKENLHHCLPQTG